MSGHSGAFLWILARLHVVYTWAWIQRTRMSASEKAFEWNVAKNFQEITLAMLLRSGILLIWVREEIKKKCQKVESISDLLHEERTFYNCASSRYPMARVFHSSCTHWHDRTPRDVISITSPREHDLSVISAGYFLSRPCFCKTSPRCGLSG